MKNQNTVWTVKGANWVWKKPGSSKSCPLEIATQALESFWNKSLTPHEDFAQEAWKQDPEARPNFTLLNGDLPSLGVILAVSNPEMKSREDHVLVASCVALANAGFYEDSKRLADAWEAEKKANKEKEQ